MIVYSKTGDVEKAQQTEQRQGRVAQQQVAAEEIKSKEIKQTQVQQTHRDEESGRIQEHPERKRGKKNAARRGSDGQAEQVDERADERDAGKYAGRIGPGSVDIRI